MEDTLEPRPEINTLAVDALWALYEQRFNELDEIRNDVYRSPYEHAEAEVRRDELSRTWNLVGQVRS